MNGILRSIPRGFSMNHHAGRTARMSARVRRTIFCASKARPCLGVPSGFQFLPMAATLNAWAVTRYALDAKRCSIITFFCGRRIFSEQVAVHADALLLA